MTASSPVKMFWDDKADVLRPVDAYWTRRAAKQWPAGEILRIVDEPERSSGSHKAYFAQINNAWESLPPLMAEQFKSPDALRRYALIKTGYCDCLSMPCASPSEAKKIAAFIRPIDEYVLVTVTASMVYFFRAKSQSYKAMGKKDFQNSKEAVLEEIARMVGASTEELKSSEPSAIEIYGTI